MRPAHDQQRAMWSVPTPQAPTCRQALRPSGGVGARAVLCMHWLVHQWAHRTSQACACRPRATGVCGVGTAGRPGRMLLRPGCTSSSTGAAPWQGTHAPAPAPAAVALPSTCPCRPGQPLTDRALWAAPGLYLLRPSPLPPRSGPTPAQLALEHHHDPTLHHNTHARLHSLRQPRPPPLTPHHSQHFVPGAS